MYTFTLEHYKTASEIFRYDPDTGHFYRKKSKYKNVLKRRITSIKNKYISLHVSATDNLPKFSINAQRLAHYIMTGEIPKLIIDHINGDHLDNRWINLRECDAAENSWNRKLSRHNQSGASNVFAVKGKKGISYRVTIRARGVNHYIGTFYDFDVAVKERDEAKRRLHGEYVRKPDV